MFFYFPSTPSFSSFNSMSSGFPSLIPTTAMSSSKYPCCHMVTSAHLSYWCQSPPSYNPEHCSPAKPLFPYSQHPKNNAIHFLNGHFFWSISILGKTNTSTTQIYTWFSSKRIWRTETYYLLGSHFLAWYVLLACNLPNQNKILPVFWDENQTLPPLWGLH